MIDGVHTENTEGYGCPQADGVGERKLKRINRELKEMGPQADGGEQVLINDERLLIGDDWLFASSSSYASFWLLMVFTRKTRKGTDVRRRTRLVNSNYQKLDSN